MALPLPGSAVSLPWPVSSEPRVFRCFTQVKGSALPMELYGFDVDWSNIPLSLGEDSFNQRDEFVDDRLSEPKVGGVPVQCDPLVCPYQLSFIQVV